MITVRSLHVHPVKSCRGIRVDRAEVVATGFRYDREWMVVDDGGRFLSQREHPSLARVATRLDSQSLTLSAPGLPTLEVALAPPLGGHRSVVVWRDRCTAVSEGAEAARWLSAVLGTPCELVRLAATGSRQVDQRYAGPDDRVAFADGFPFLLISQASLDELNLRLSRPVSADRFRANIVIEGCTAHAEDGWLRFEIGGVGFRVAKPCARCVVVTTDQQTGARSPEPLRTLAGYRTTGGKVIFGQNLVHDGPGTVRLGDPLRRLLHR